MEQNIFWDKKLTQQDAKKILSNNKDDRFSEIAALLLSRTNNSKLVFLEYLTKEIFCQQWKRIKSEMRKNKWGDERIDFWDQIHKTIYKQIGQTTAIRKKKEPRANHEFSNIAGILRNERKKQEITQKILAKKAGVSQQTISHIESGIGDVSLGTIRKISTVLNLEIKIGPRQ